MRSAPPRRALLGKAVTNGGVGWITIHPSNLLRIQDHGEAEEEFGRFVEDLKAAKKSLG